MPNQVAGIKLDQVNSSAYTSDQVKAWLENVNLQSDTLTVEAVATSSANAYSETGKNLNLFSFNGNVTKAGIGYNTNKRQSAEAGVTGGSVVSSKDIVIRAFNSGMAVSNIKSGTDVSLIGHVANRTLPTESIYYTRAFADGNTHLTSLKGSISITTEDDARAQSIVSGENTSVGGIINLDYTKGENQATVSNVIDLQGVMEAYTHFTAHTVSDANLNAQSHKQGSGFVAVNRISASNRLDRNVSINVLDGTEITANFGNLDILAEAGRGDNITTRVTIDSNGVVATAKIQIDVTVNSEVTLNMGQVKLQNRFGTVNIKADSSADNVDSVGSTDASGLGTAPNASVNNSVTLTAKVVIEGKAGAPATIEGTIVNIVSYIGTLYVNGHAYSKGSSLGADVDATSNQTISLTAQTTVDYADVTAHDRADIYASVKPEYRSSNIRYYAAVQLNAVGHGKAKSAGAVTRSAETIIGSGFIYRGAQVTITSYDFDKGRIECNLRDRGFIYHESDQTNSFGGDIQSTTVADGATFYLGDAAGGMFVDIAYTGESGGKIIVRQAGVRQSDFYGDDGSTVTLADLVNNLPGTAYLYGTVGNILVYDQARIPGVTITNATSRKVVLHQIFTRNSGYIKPSVYVDGVRKADNAQTPSYEPAALRVITSGTGDVHVESFLLLYDGSITVEWTGETGGKFTAVQKITNASAQMEHAPIWTSRLCILNAASIGTETDPVNVWLTSCNADSAWIQATAQGDIFLNVTPAVVFLENGTGGNTETPVHVQEVRSTQGDVDLTLGTLQNVTMKDNALFVTIPVPGTLSYEAKEVTLDNDCTIDGLDILDRYRNQYDAATGLYGYQLPNGTVFWMDAYHNVSRIEENDTTMAVGDYTFYEENGKVTAIWLSNGVRVDLDSGNLYIEEDASFDVLFSVIDAAAYFFPGGSFSEDVIIRLSKSDYTQGEVLEEEDVVEWDVRPELLYEVGNVAYYSFTGLKPLFENLTNSDNTLYYILRYDKNTNSLDLFTLSTPGQGVEDTSDNRDYFKFMTGGTTDDGSYRTIDGPNPSRETEQPAHYLNMARQDANMVFTFEDFLDTGSTVTLEYGKDGTPKLRLAGGSHDIPLILVDGLGYTAGAATADLTDAERTFLEQLTTRFFNTETSRQVADTVKSYDKNGGYLGEIRANNGTTFKLAEHTWTHREVRKFIGIDFLAKDVLTPRYQYAEFTMYSHSMTVSYTELLPTDASLALEYYSSGKKYTTTVGGQEYVFYENPADGAWYTSENFEPNTKVVFVEQEDVDHYVYTITVGDLKVTFRNPDPIQEGVLYELEERPGVFAELKNNKITLVTAEEIYERLEETQEFYSYETGNIILKDGDVSYTVTPAETPEAGENDTETEVEVDKISDGVTIVKKNDGKYYLKTVTEAEEGKEDQVTYKELTEGGKESVTTDYAPMQYAQADSEGNKYQVNFEPVVVQMGSDGKPVTDENGNFTIIDPGKPLYYKTTDKGTENEGTLYYLVKGTKGQFAVYSSVRYSSDSEGVFYRETRIKTYLDDSRYENLTPESTQVMVPNGKEVLMNADGTPFAGGSIFRTNSRYTGTERPAQFVESSYITALDRSNAKLVLRVGSANDDGSGSMVSIDGPIPLDPAAAQAGTDEIAVENRPIPLKPVSVPENSQTGAAAPGYRITDNLYLTQSGLAVNLVINGENQITFASKYDGSIYTSDNIQASAFGSLGQLRELDYDVNGMILCDGKLYLKMGDVLAEYADGELKLLNTEQTNAILYEEAPNLNNTPNIRINQGQQVKLERLTNEIFRDIQGRYWFRDGDGNFHQATATESNARSSGEVITVSYNGTDYLIIYSEKDDTLVDGDDAQSGGNVIVCYEMPQMKLVAKSDGTVVSTGSAEPDVKVQPSDDSTRYSIGTIVVEGEDKEIVIRLDSEHAALVNGNPDPDGENIRTNGGDVTIIAQGDGASIGTDPENPLIINAGSGNVHVQSPDNTQVIAVNTYLILPEDTTLTPDYIIVDGVIYQVAGKNPDKPVNITATSLRVINGGTADISTDGSLYLTYLGVDDHDSTGGSSAKFHADQNVEILEFVTNEGETHITGGGEGTFGTITTGGEAHADIETAGSITVSDGVSVQGKSQLDMTSTNGGAVIEQIETMDKANAVIHTAEDLSVTTTASASGESHLNLVSDSGGSVQTLTASDQAQVTLDVATQARIETMDAAGGTVIVTSDGTVQADTATASNSGTLKTHAAGDITLDTIDIEDAWAVFTSLSADGQYALPENPDITGGGTFTARYVEADRSRLEIDVWGDLRIFDEQDDQPILSDEMKDVLVLRDMSGSDLVDGTNQTRGAYLTSRHGAVDSTHDDYILYTNPSGQAIFQQDGVWYQLENNRFVKLDSALDLTGYVNRGIYSLYIGQDDETESNYMAEYAGMLILERSGDFYRIGSDGQVSREEILSSDFLKAQMLLNVGARNYFDSWLADNATLEVTAYGDIQVRDSVRFMNYTNATLTSTNGGILVADYYMDTDGDGIGDALQPSRYLVKNSTANLTAGGGDVRTDRVYVEVSFAAVDDCTGDVNSKTWYILGSRFPIHLDGDVNVISADADNPLASPAAQILWSNEDFYIWVPVNGVLQYVQTGVEIISENGGVWIEAMDGDVSTSNTLDFYAIASTIDVQAAKDIRIPEMQLNTPNENIKLDDGTPVTSSVYHSQIFRDLNGNMTPMTAEDLPDLAEHIYGTELSMISSGGGFIANHITVDSGLTPDGTGVSQPHGTTVMDVQTSGDIDILFNLTGRTAEHIAQYGENIAQRALTVNSGSQVSLKSTDGGITVLDPKGNGAKADILLTGLGTQAAQLRMEANEDLRTNRVEAEKAEVYLRTVGENTQAGDLLIHRIQGKDLILEMDSAGDIRPAEETNLMIQLTGDSTLRLAAVGDIGTLDHAAFIDVPCKVIVDRVNSFYADFNLRDFETYEQIQQIKEYAITQGYLVSQAEAMAEKLLTVLKQDYLDNSDLRFYNIVLDESTILAIRTVLGREEEEEPLTADDLIQGFAQLDSQTRQDILTALFRTALADGQGLDEVEDGLRTRNQELEQLAQRKQQILEQLTGEKPLTQEQLEQLRQEYIQAEAREQTLRQEIRDLNDRKADIQDGYRDYVEDDSDMEALLAQANSLNPQDENFLEQAWSLLDRLTSKDAFNDQSLTSGRLAAQAIFQAAQTAAKAVQSQAAALLDQVFTTKSQQQAQALVQLKALTEQIADLEALSDRAYTAGQTLNNTHVDVPARSSEVLIGEIQGELYLTNEGSISVTVDSGHKPVSRFEPNLDHIRIGDHDVLLGEIYSHRGDVTIENVTAGITAKTLEPGHANITAHEITLKAHGSIGSEGQSVITEQRDVVPSKVVSVVEEIYQGQLADQTVSGDSLPGKGAIGIQTGQRYESLDGTLELVEVTLLLADGSKLTAPIRLEDLRKITRQANTTGGNVYNFLTDSEGTAAALQIVTRYDWVRYLDPMAGTRTDAESQTGSIYLKENSGTLNIGQIRAAEHISLEAPGGVYSVLTEDEQDKQNIHTEGENAQVTVDAGTGGVGTSDNPLTVQVSGENAWMTTHSDDGVYLRGTGDLRLKVDDESRHIEVALTEAVKPSDVADLTIQDITVGGADTLTGYALSLGSLELHTPVNVGTQDQPFQIATDASKAGTLILSGDNVYLNQSQGDLLVQDVDAAGDFRLWTAGSIVDASDSRVTELLREYAEKLAQAADQQEILDKLQAELNAILNDNAEENRKQELENAKQGAQQAQTQYDQAAAQTDSARELVEQYRKNLNQAIQSGDADAIAQAREDLALAQEALAQAQQTQKLAQEALKAAEERLQAAQEIQDKFDRLEQTKEQLRDAYLSGDSGAISGLWSDYQAAREDTAPYTDYIHRVGSDLEITQEILEQLLGPDFRNEYNNLIPEEKAKYEALMALWTSSREAMDQVTERMDILTGDETVTGSVAQAQKETDELLGQLANLVEQIRQAEAAGSGPALNVGGDADITAGGAMAGSIHDEDDYLTIRVDGELNTQTDGDTKLLSPGTVNIGTAHTGGHSLDIIAIGDVNVGSTDASHFSGAGGNISVNVDGSVEVGDILADREDGHVDIIAGGDVKQEQDTAIHGDSLNIDAGGDVDVNVHVNEIDVDAGGSVDITSGKPTLVVDGIHAGEDVNIDEEGSVVSDGGDGIHAGGDVNIDAGGNIGSLDEDLVIDAGGDVTWDSEYGLGFIRIVTDKAKDSQGPYKIWDDPDARSYAVRKADGTLETCLRPGTGLEVFGRNLQNTFLWVGTESLRKEIFGHAENTMHLTVTAAGEVLFDYWVAIDRIVGYLAENGTYIPVIEPDDSGAYLRQSLTFRLYVGSQYDGWTFTVDTGRYQVRGEVEDGYLCFTLPAGQASIQVELAPPVL